MADPKIRYDVEATASGEADVGRLAAQLGKLDAAIDPAAAARAQELAAKLRELGQQEQAIQSFVRLKNALNTTSSVAPSTKIEVLRNGTSAMLRAASS